MKTILNLNLGLPIWMAIKIRCIWTIAAVATSLLAAPAAHSAPGAPRRDGVENRPPTIGFETRLASQRAIEEVYWKHRIWPAENPKPKPPLEAVMPLELIRARVEDSLRLSNALEAYWGQAITGAQLQAEIERQRPEQAGADADRHAHQAAHV